MDKSQLKVSIIVPCYNQAQYLDECLQSILEQTYINWECIIVNDGSSDNTEIVAQEWINKDARFKYINKDNGGLSSARNTGLENVNGDYIQFLDSDDFIHKEKFESAFSIIQKDTECIVISNFTKFQGSIDKTIPTFWELKLESISYHNILFNWDNSFAIPIHCGLFPALCFENFRFPTVLNAKEDWIMWISIFKNNPKCYFINEKLAFYRVQPVSMTSDASFLNTNYIKALKYIKALVTSDEYEKLLLLNIERKSMLFIEWQNKFRQIKDSNSYKVGFKIKGILKKVSLLDVLKKMFKLN
ncbi:glycosyltransferase family 2 protein [Flavobacterium ajazii]|uniref:glycosyltransferase family 2 protein n=1 Tax=Flavobacterium ajazii TaxID=2692318 RepID=UPI0013D2D20B|nr:glycosyltransferase family 2 protein [Flavobacterium ajazii]